MAPWLIRKLFGDSRTVLKILSLLVGCLGMGVAGSFYAFNAYSNAVKATYNLTQTEVELLASLGNFGMGIAFPAGLMVEKLGSPPTHITGSLITCSIFMALWSSATNPEFYNDNFYLLCLYFLIGGFGAIFSYMPGLIINVKNFTNKHRGKVVSIMDSAFSGGPMIFVAVYGIFFVNGHVSDERNQNLSGYFLMVGITFFVINIIGCIFVWELPPENNENPSIPNQEVNASDRPTMSEDMNHSIEREIGGDIANSTEEYNMTGLDLLRDKTFHFIFWPFVFCSSLQITTQNNIAVYLKSFNQESYTTGLTTFAFAVGMVAKLVAGFFSDLLQYKIPRITFLLVANTLQTAILFGCIFYAQRLPYLYTTVFIMSTANGFLWCLTPTMMSEAFGTRYLGRNWGGVMLGTSVSGWITQLSFGALYTAEISDTSEEERYCEGLHCFTWSFVMAFVMSIVSSALNVVYFTTEIQTFRLRWRYQSLD